MKHLLSNREAVEALIGERRVALCLDFDGTLAPIAPTPELAVVSAENRQMLLALQKSRRCTVAIVSGRALSDLKEKVGVEDLIYIGNHGLEAEGPAFSFESLVPPRDDTMIRLKNDLMQAVDGIEGVFLEDKHLTLSVHYRLARIEDIPMLQKLVVKTCRPYLADKKVHLREGKKVLEIRPSLDWDKGKAVVWLLTREQAAEGHAGEPVVPIYFGDDMTDEDAFRALSRQGVTVLVGMNDLSDAQYYVNGLDEVTEFLRHLHDFLGRKAMARG